jgi:hypothetical protein
MITDSCRAALRAAALLAVAALAGCESGETIAPDGATLDLTAAPASIVLDQNGIQAAPVALLATVRDKIGIPLEDQDVRFTTTSGVLNPAAGTPVPTDRNGNAVSILTGATQGPTVVATSGKATDTLSITAATGELATIILSPNSLDLQNCSDTFPGLTATALKPNGDPLGGIAIEFVLEKTTGAGFVTGTFNPSPGVSDPITGEVTTTFTVTSSVCQSECALGKSCSNRITARNVGQTVVSNFSTIVDNVN